MKATGVSDGLRDISETSQRPLKGLTPMKATGVSDGLRDISETSQRPLKGSDPERPLKGSDPAAQAISSAIASS